MSFLRRVCIALLGSLATLSCGSDEGSPGIGGAGIPLPHDEGPAPTLVCPSFVKPEPFPEMVMFNEANAPSLGAIDGAFSVSPTGSARYSIPLTLPPARRFGPSLGIVYDSHAPSGMLGKGFSLAGLSSIHRCGSNLAQDNQIRGVDLTPEDHFCIDGTRLVEIKQGKNSIGYFAEYRTVPDSHTKVVAYGAPAIHGFDPTYFIAHLADGNTVEYGKSVGRRVRWRGVTRSWSKELEVDPRGNTIRYAYFTDNGNDKDVTTREQVIANIWYTGFIDENGVETLGNARVDFDYDDNDRHGKLFYEGEEISRTMRLRRIDMRMNGVVVRSNYFDYENDPITNEALLVKVDECAKGDLSQCKPATHFHWHKALLKGFGSHATNIHVPDKSDDDRFSYSIADVTGDGAVDVITSSTNADTGMNLWHVYENDGHGQFGGAVQWTSFAYPKGFGKQWRITPVDHDGDGRIDLLIDHPNVTEWYSFGVLRSVPHPWPHFELVPTGIPRTSQFRASEFTVDSHSGLAVADVNADGMNDLITCHDLRTWYGVDEYVEDNCDGFEDCKPSLARWAAYLWRPVGGPGGGGGFDKTERHIEALDGVSCWTMSRFFGAVDWNADGQTELVTAGKDGHFWTHQLSVPSLQWDSKPLAMALPNVLGVNVWDDPVANHVVYPLTNGRAEQMESEWAPLRALFPDVNGDAYPDMLFVGPKYTTSKPFVVVNEGRDEYTGYLWPYDTIDGNVNTFYHSPFARVFDFSGDGRDDLAMPVGGACQSTDADTCYVIFESGNIGESPTVIPTDIPFENPDGESVAPQYLLRTADTNVDGLTDIVHPTAGAQMMVFENLSTQNVLRAVTTGRNPLDPADAGFLPDVTFEYGNLLDTSKKGLYQKQTYLPRMDSSNTCAYPRACVVGGQHVVSAYTLNNGNSQARRFTMHYRDGRAHRLGRGYLGFGEVETRDADTGLATRQRFDNVTFEPTSKTFPFAGRVAETRTTTPLPTTTLETTTSAVHEVVSTNAGQTYFVMTRSMEKLRKEGTDVLERSWTIVDDVDDFGNVLQSHAGSDNVDVLNTSTRVVENHVASWLLGLVTEETTCSTALGETQCRTSTMEHTPFGEPFRIDRAPNDPTAHIVTYLIRDRYGNVTNTMAEDD